MKLDWNIKLEKGDASRSSSAPVVDLHLSLFGFLLLSAVLTAAALGDLRPHKQTQKMASK